MRKRLEILPDIPIVPADSQMHQRSTDTAGALVSTLSNRSVGERSRVVREIADLFLKQHESYSTEQVELFDSVMIRLIDRIGEEVRSHLSEQLATVDNAPREVVRNLASDGAIAVAGPVLSQSACLDEEFLIESARTQGQDHLMAISSRKTVGHRVTDVLVDRGNDQVAVALARNEGAKFSEQGYSVMVDRAKDDQQLARAVWLRQDIPRQQLLALFEKASDAVRRELEAQADKKAQEIATAVRLASQRLQEKSQQSSAAYAQAKSSVAALQQNGGLSETHILSFASQEKFEEVVVAMSELSKLSAADIERTILEEQNDRLLVTSRAIGLSWTCLRHVLLMNKAKPRTSQQLEQLRIRFQSIARATAVKGLQFYQLREKARIGPAQASP
jgi:uncharacterized protein (DUF2336 family)